MFQAFYPKYRAECVKGVCSLTSLLFKLLIPFNGNKKLGILPLQF